MAYFHLNGIQIPIESCEVGHVPIASSEIFSPSGVYQRQRNGVARRWKCRTGLLTTQRRLELLDLLSDRGDHWRFDMATADRPIVNGDSYANFYSDRRRAAYDASGIGNDPVAQVESCVAADGIQVIDYNGVSHTPWAGCTGFSRVEVATSNLMSDAGSKPTSTSWTIVLGGAVLSTDTDRYWEGTSCLGVQCAASADGVTSASTSSGTTVGKRYVCSAHVLLAPGESITVEVEEPGVGLKGPVAYSATESDPAWYEVQAAGTSTSGFPLRMQIKSTSGAQTFYVDGAMIEQLDAGNMTGWIAGGTSRAAGDLQYDNLLTSMTTGMSFAAWVKHIRTGLSATHLVFDAGVFPNSRIYMLFGNLDRPQFIATEGESGAASTMAAVGAAVDNQWHHWACVYDPTQPILSLYKDGLLHASDTTPTLTRILNPATIPGDFHINNWANGPSFPGPGPVTSLTVLPFAAGADLVSQLYNSGNGYGGGVPGLAPLLLHGSVLGLGEQSVQVVAQVDGSPHVQWWQGNTFQEQGGHVAFSLTEVTAR